MADFYGSVAGYEAWADARGISYPDDDDATQQALIRASEYIDGAFRAQFPGYRTEGRSQTREWPRYGATDREGYVIASDEVPAEIALAAYEGAKREIAVPGSLQPDIVAGGGVKKRVRTGPVEIEYVTDGSVTATVQAIERVLGGLFRVGSRYSQAIVRA
jgi:hypothetical protein